MFATIINVIVVIIGSLIGILLQNGIKDKYKITMTDGIGLAVLLIGITGATQSNNIILVIISLVLGGLIGELIGIEDRLDKLGDNMGNRFGKADSNFSKGFVTASLMFCVGAMAIVGSLEAGLLGNYQTIYAKSILDGISAVIFASTLGIGVAFAAIPVFVYQGSITMLAFYLKDILTDTVVLEMSAVGGVLIIAIGINILGLKKIKVGNMLPAIFIPIVYYIIVGLM